MIIKKHVIFLTCIFIAQAFDIFTRDFPLSLWKNYQLNQHKLVISHSTEPFTISLSNRVQNQWKSLYEIGQQKILIRFTNQQQVLQVLGNGNNLLISGLKEGEQIVLSSSILSADNYELAVLKDGEVVNKQILAKLVVQNFDALRFRIKDTSFGNNLQEQKAIIKVESSNRLQHFFNTFKIDPTYSEFGGKMLSKTFSQLCRQKHKDLSFIGICYNIHQGKRHSPQYKIDVRYSPLIIDRLFAVYPRTALFLFQELTGLLEDQVFYSDAEFVQIPEHISIIRGFINTLKSENSTAQKLKVRVKSLLNGLMNQMLLSQVNSLQQEINYRQNKKMHPTLVKMVSLKWQSNSRKNALSSIYQESFMPDYFYNYANQSPDNCVSKFAWLTAATAQYVLFIKSFGNKDDMDALQQSVSLFKILQQVSGSDSKAKQGLFYSINQAEGVRVYVQQVGYESFLPYVYELTSIFPEQFLKNITTPTGLASLNSNHAKFSSKFQFRGNVHTYFNYKILFQARRRLQTSKNQRALGAVESLISKVRQKIIQFDTQGKHFTSWATSGQGIRDRQGLSIISLLLLGQKR